MARIQILELPMQEGDDGKTVTPFAIILDDCGNDGFGLRSSGGFDAFARECGARACLISDMPVEVPGLTAEEIATINRPTTEAVRGIVDAVKPSEIHVHIGDREITDIIRAELAENNRAVADSLSDGRG